MDAREVDCAMAAWESTRRARCVGSARDAYLSHAGRQKAHFRRAKLQVCALDQMRKSVASCDTSSRKTTASLSRAPSMHATGASPLRARLASFSSIALLLSAGAPIARACPAAQPSCRRAVAKTSSPGGNAFRPVSTSSPRASTRMPAHYRHDGVRIQHDPYSPGMAEKYGTPGNTDDEGFDPYADSVGAGIYGGRVKRDASNGAVVIGAQYQNHNTRPGPVYAGGGYTPVSAAIASFAKELRSGEADSEDTTTLGKLLHAFPDLVNDVSTGGATPLHTCGMSQTNQLATKFIIEKGGDIEALDTYGYTPLDRMASNNLAVGARALIAAGADPRSAHGGGEGPRQIARSSEARDVLRALDDVLDDDVRHSSGSTIVTSVRVFSSTRPEIDGLYVQRDGTVSVPVKFAEVCLKNGWDVDSTWSALNGGAESVWFAHSAGETKNPSYVYFNKNDGCWWIDGPDGLGVFKASGPPHAPPGASIAWRALDGKEDQPTLAAYRGKREF